MSDEPARVVASVAPDGQEERWRRARMRKPNELRITVIFRADLDMSARHLSRGAVLRTRLAARRILDKHAGGLH
jgi:hypothetical protein